MTGNTIKDRDGTLMFDPVKYEFGDVCAGKRRRGLADHRVMPRDFIGPGVFAFAIQFENAMLDAFGFVCRNADQIDDCARPPPNQ